LIATGPAPARELQPWTGGEQPVFALDALSEERIGLTAFPDRVVIVHFFATWCEPCRPEMAALRRLAGRFAQKPLVLLAISVAEPDIRVRKFFDAEPVSFPILLDRDRSVAKAWQVSALPTTFVLDRSLAPRFVAEGDVEWDRVDSDLRLEALVSDPIGRRAQPDVSD
jgi:peroxiredoxin